MAEPKVRFRKSDGSSYPEWDQGRFGDLIEIYDEKVTSDCTLPVLTSSKTDGIQYQSDHFGREQLHDITGYNVIPRGCCTYRNRSDGTDFTFNINNLCDRGIVSKFYPVFHATERCNLYFLMTLMNNEPKTVRKIAMTAKGTGQKVLSFLDLQKIEINIPCIEEQQKIAEFLSTVDEVIATSEEEVANLETQKKAVMKKIFSQEVRFKRKDGCDFSDWEEKTTDDVLQTITDYVAAGSFADIAKNVQYQSEGYAQLVRTVDLKNHFTSKEEIFVSEDAFNYLWRVNLDKESIVMPNVGNCGEIYYVTPEMLPYAHNVLGPNAIVVRSDTVNNKFVAYFMESEGFQEQLKLIVSPSGQRKFNKTEFKRLLLYIPIEEEQCLIVDFLSDFDEAINEAKKELALWKELKKGLLQQMFV